MPFKKKPGFASRVKRFVFKTLFIFAVASAVAVGVLRFIPPPTSAFMLHRHFEDYRNNRKFTAIRHTWVDRSKISRFAFGAVIAAEDQRFYRHHGFDVNSIFDALDGYLAGGKLRGASTISQQTAKNLFLTPQRSFLRKGIEVWFTLLIEMLWSKERILEVYLNVAEFGDHLFGIEAASRQYFSVSANQLSPGQAALLAATLPNPRKLKADRPSAYLYRRRSWILGQMKNLGYLH
ncbi:MAG: monofunctional biosynthetic peptidoglycan transglycosylase [Gammaproteobacteria bacterium]